MLTGVNDSQSTTFMKRNPNVKHLCSHIRIQKSAIYVCMGKKKKGMCTKRKQS